MGEVILAGYDGKLPMPLNTFLLQQSIAKATPSSTSATGLVRGIWKDESVVDRALATAKTALQNVTIQSAIDSARRRTRHRAQSVASRGKYPDPYDLPTLNTLPDPFTFFNGTKVRSVPSGSSDAPRSRTSPSIMSSATCLHRRNP